MLKRWIMATGLCWWGSLMGTTSVDEYVKNLTLVGVIHVAGGRSQSQSVAVLREKVSGKTKILHKGDTIVEGDLEVRELGPQQITLVRGAQQFVLRVETQTSTSVAQSDATEKQEAIDSVENSEDEIGLDTEGGLVEMPVVTPTLGQNLEDAKKLTDPTPSNNPQRFEPSLIQE